MAVTGTRVRRGRSVRAAPGAVAVTGAAGPLGRALVERLVAARRDGGVVAIDVDDPAVDGAMFRRADVRDRVLRARLDGVGTVVHLATSRDPVDDPVSRRAVNVRGTEGLLEAAVAAGVRRVVLLTSAMVYGAHPDNHLPLPEDGPLRAEPDAGLVGDWVEMERLASVAVRGRTEPDVVRVRPASLVGAVTDPVLPRLFDAPRLLVLKGSPTVWQFCHTDDLLDALEYAVDGRVVGAVTVGATGWLEQAEVERISRLRPIVVPASLAVATAERLHRIGVVSAPASELRYLAAPWVVGAQRLRAAGWEPRWSNADALAAHVDATRSRSTIGGAARSNATRAAAGAAVAVAGSLALARARARRRRLS